MSRPCAPAACVGPGSCHRHDACSIALSPQAGRQVVGVSHKTVCSMARMTSSLQLASGINYESAKRGYMREFNVNTWGLHVSTVKRRMILSVWGWRFGAPQGCRLGQGLRVLLLVQAWRLCRYGHAAKGQYAACPAVLLAAAGAGALQRPLMHGVHSAGVQFVAVFGH
jgi:hypothetical protein